MTALLALLAADANAQASALPSMMNAMRQRGGGEPCAWTDDNALVAVARADWEGAPHTPPGLGLAERDGIAVVADATLYYRDDLRQALADAGVATVSESPAALILAAYRAWGLDAASHLEGDFAFVLRDSHQGRLVCARDFAGTRPLYWAQRGALLVVASSPEAIVTHPLIGARVDLVALAETVAGLVAASDATAYQGVRRLDAGTMLVAQDDGSVQTTRFWNPPPVHEEPLRTSFDDAAAELRALLEHATAERLPHHGDVAVWLSGGYDSPAVAAAAANVARASGNVRVNAVSMSYPEGDPGREDERIAEVADKLGMPVRWRQIDDVPLMHNDAVRADARALPFGHPFEMWNRALAAGALDCGARVALTGQGGDELFSSTDAFLADLAMRGRWLRLAQEWRTEHGRSPRGAFRRIAHPLFPKWMRRAWRAMGRPVRAPFERTLPAWIDRDFARKHHLLEREQEHAVVRHRGERRADFEMRWFLSDRFLPAITETVAGFAFEEGVEMRMPLLDARVVRFAAARPWDERASGGETKRLLRAAMRDVLPPEAVAARTSRSGVTSGYLHGWLRDRGSNHFVATLRTPLLGELGIIEPRALRDALARYLRTGDGLLALNLYQTYQAELWVRARLRSAPERARVRVSVASLS